MLNLDLYIHSTGTVSPAADLHEPVVKLLSCEPDYSAYIPPMQLRRTSKVVRMGIGAAKACLTEAGLEKPHALSIGTAMGCLQDTEVFLSKMVVQEEKMLTPTAFIQSTHNTVGGQIALLVGCHGHNMTYVHSGHSFEHALLNTQLYLQDHPDETMLTGGIDELTDTSHTLMQRAAVYTDTAAVPANLQDGNTLRPIAGEGASFFSISRNAAQACLRVINLHLFITTAADAALAHAGSWLQQQMAAGDIDLILMGENGTDDPFYQSLREHAGDEVSFATFKQYCGEYATAGAFGLSLLVQCMKKNAFPDYFFLNHPPQKLQRIAIVNHYCNHYSCWMLEVPE